MPLSEVNAAIYYYLQPSVSKIPYLGTVYEALPKVANESDLYTSTYPGQGLGAVIYMFATDQFEERIALGGQHEGVKMREYAFGLLVVFKSDLPEIIDGQLAYYTFIDNLTAWIQADRNAGTEAVSLGGIGPYAGTGTVWSWGEGGINGGPDIRIQHSLPRPINGGVTIFQSVVNLRVVEQIDV